MKKSLFTIFLIGVLGASASLAQGTLQFNQVLILNNGITYTVPAGKVWKVESAVYNSYYIDYTNSARVMIDGAAVELLQFTFYDGNSYGRVPYSTAFPMWLPANTTIQPTLRVSKMFVIEFNVVP